MASSDKPISVDVTDALETMRDHAGMSADGVSLRLGRYRSWLRGIRGRDPHLSIVADVASATGCEVVIRDQETGETVAIVAPPDPTERKRLGPTKSEPDTSQSSPETS